MFWDMKRAHRETNGYALPIMYSLHSLPGKKVHKEVVEADSKQEPKPKIDR
jgi:hypothetical protein